MQRTLPPPWRSIVGIAAVTIRPWRSSAVREAGARLRQAVSDIAITWPPPVALSAADPMVEFGSCSNSA